MAGAHSGAPGAFPLRDAGTPRRRRASGASLRDTLTAYLFISPAALVIGVFGIFPVFFTVYVSLFKWRPGGKAGFLLLGNYAEIFGANLLPIALCAASIAGIVFAGLLLRRRPGGRGVARSVSGSLLLAGSLVAFAVTLPRLFTQSDREVFDALRVTIWYCLLTVPVQLAAGVVLAVMLFGKARGTQAFRVITLVPYIAPTVASAAIFELLLSLRPESFANQILHLIGKGPLQWLQEPKGVISLILGAAPQAAGVVPAYWADWAQGPSLALVSIIIYSWWVFIGYYALIYLNGLGQIPRQLYEAAEVDGASRLRRFFSITLPLLSPTTYFLTLLGVIGTFKAFTHLYVLRHASAAGTVDSISVSIFFTFFRKGRLGYASAMSIVLFLIVIGLTVLQQRSLGRKVTYGD
jgi:multiple sugar transport system permease protein